MADDTGIRIDIRKRWNWREFFFQWEWLLVLIFLGVHVVNSFLSPYYLNLDTFISTPSTFLDKSFIVFPMMFVIVLGMIDISVGSIVALSAVIMAVSFNAGLPMPAAMLLCLAVATTAGMINGLLITKFKELSSVIVTLSTMIIYRGIAYIILGDQASGRFPAWYSYLGWGSFLGLPFIVVCFIASAAIFGLILHKTRFGRSVFGMGNNGLTCRYSGIDTDRVTFLVFMVTGFMAGVTALFLTSRMGSTRPNVAQGYELEVIAMVVLGGVSTTGGVGRIAGPILAIFIIGFLGYGMGLANIQAPAVLVVIGLLLILSVLAMRVRFKIRKKSAAV